MYFAKVSANGQITLPADLRRKLGLSPGDKALFVERRNGEILVTNPAQTALADTYEPAEHVAPTLTPEEKDAEMLSREISPEFMPDLPEGTRLTPAEVHSILIHQAHTRTREAWARRQAAAVASPQAEATLDELASSDSSTTDSTRNAGNPPTAVEHAITKPHEEHPAMGDASTDDEEEPDGSWLGFWN